MEIKSSPRENNSLICPSAVYCFVAIKQSQLDKLSLGSIFMLADASDIYVVTEKNSVCVHAKSLTTQQESLLALREKVTQQQLQLVFVAGGGGSTGSSKNGSGSGHCGYLSDGVNSRGN